VIRQEVNSVGVDLNALKLKTHKQRVLDFVAGLGPISAANILNHLKQKDYFESRDELLREGILRKNIYENCAGFLFIGEAFENKKSPLDYSRIHPKR
jgi:transcriptional accessory protein Tex/SPT6